MKFNTQGAEVFTFHLMIRELVQENAPEPVFPRQRQPFQQPQQAQQPPQQPQPPQPQPEEQEPGLFSLGNVTRFLLLLFLFDGFESFSRFFGLVFGMALLLL
jgi:hypothetical protein